MRAVITCVNYADFLAWTLPYNKHHFESVIVVTDERDDETVDVAESNGVDVVRTDRFYARGAKFAKYDGIEAGLDRIGTDGWIALLDADVRIPSGADMSGLECGFLYGPRRRMCKDFPPPEESAWGKYPMDETTRMGKRYPPDDWFLGYMHVFHGCDPHLGERPWHGAGHKSAARGDMALFRKWPLERRIRLPFDVLHLGEERRNWYGRVTGRYGASG